MFRQQKIQIADPTERYDIAVHGIEAL